MSLHYELSYIKQHYRDIFTQAQQALEALLLAHRDAYACDTCSPPPGVLDPISHAGCGFSAWKTHCLSLLEQDIGGQILAKIQEIETARNQITCHQCGVCCRFASSEFSYETLLEKGSNGDAFARQFTSVFLPYASTEAARARFPELVDQILTEVRAQQAEQLGQQSSVSKNNTDSAPVYFYHCPYIGEDNRCSIYGTPKRPEICAGYPDTPLTFIYNKCAWKPWKDEYHHDSLMTHASIELCLFYAEKLRTV